MVVMEPERPTGSEWAHAGRGLLGASGLLCVALALHRGDGLVDLMLRSYVGLLGCVLAGFAGWSALRR